MAKQTLNIVRINAGEWRSRLLKFPDAQGLRPTPERVRQTVFNWLGQDLTGLNCLDLFAGSGVMGFEALSRNAKSAVLVEKSVAVYRAILENKTALKAEVATVLNQDALQFLQHNRQLFDVVFLDPPYGQGLLTKVLPCLAAHLTADAVVYACVIRSAALCASSHKMNLLFLPLFSCCALCAFGVLNNAL